MTKAEKIAALKAEYPTLTKGVNDEVVTMDAKEYESTIAAWADVELAAEAEAAAEAQKAADREALLTRLGISNDEAKLLLG